MKRFLRLLGQLCPISTSCRRGLSTLVAGTNLFMCLLAAQQVSAQAEPAGAGAIQPLQIGDTIPEYLWHLPLQVVNPPPAGGKETITLNDHRGKLIILDFWATWCGSCIEAMPKLDSLQRNYRDEMAVIPVSYEAPGRIRAFLATHATAKETGLAFVAEDAVLKRLFPHSLLPHVVWIDPSGKVHAETATDALHAANIEVALVGETIVGQHKQDLDLGKPLFLDGKLPGDGLQHYSVLWRGRVDGLPSGMQERQLEGNKTGVAFTNATLAAMYRNIAHKLIPGFSMKRLLILGEPEEGAAHGPGRLDRGLEEGLYTFDAVVPIEERKRLYQYALTALSNHTGYQASVQQVDTLCLVLRYRSGGKDLASGGGRMRNTLYGDESPRKLQASPMASLVAWLNQLDGEGLLVLDETAYAGSIDIVLHSDPSDYGALRQELATYGLALYPEPRTVDMLVLEHEKHVNR